MIEDLMFLTVVILLLVEIIQILFTEWRLRGIENKQELIYNKIVEINEAKK